jgi:hypothetical protein
MAWFNDAALEVQSPGNNNGNATSTVLGFRKLFDRTMLRIAVINGFDENIIKFPLDGKTQEQGFPRLLRPPPQQGLLNIHIQTVLSTLSRRVLTSGIYALDLHSYHTTRQRLF